MRPSMSEDAGRRAIPAGGSSVGPNGSGDMAAKDSSRPRAENTEDTEVAGPAEARERPGNPSDDVRAILDDMDEALEENPEEIVRSYVQEGGQ